MKNLTPAIILLLASIAPHSFAATTRTVKTINEAWLFTKEGRSCTVNLPHTWNAADAADDEKGFWRGQCSYEKTLRLSEEAEQKQVYIRFEGAYQNTSLIVNGQEAGRHTGGYTAFIFDITGLVHKGDNHIKVLVDNSFDPNVPTLTADYTFFGGIYRDVELILAPKVLVAPDHFASPGVFLSSPDGSTLKADTRLSNHTSSRIKAVLEQKLVSPSGEQAAIARTRVTLPPSCDRIPVSMVLKPAKVERWDVDSPVVYRVETSLYEAGKGGKLIDRVTNPFGFRTFAFDPDKGFSLNGRPLKIMGTNRHQDYMGKGNALPDENHVRDVRLLKDMGGNFLRISHYPQDPLVATMCDIEGIVNSVEIPIVNTVTCSEEFASNCVQMAREMVYQGFNHPSTIIWAYMNEVLIRPPFSGKTSESDKEAYYGFVRELARRIDGAIREIDPGRPTMIPCEANFKVYKKSGVGEIPDILGWNVYKGWYGGVFEEFGTFMDRVHAAFPDKALIVSEYGADNDVRCHSFEGEKFDFTEEYAVDFHKAYIKTILEKPFIAGSAVWNLCDFYSEERSDAIPHVNCKGLLTRDRMPKDSYHLYRAVLGKEPFIRISGHDWPLRGGDEGDVQKVEVYTNAGAVSLKLNGKDLGIREAKEGYAGFEVSFKNGKNILEATATKDGTALRDLLEIDYRAIPKDMSEFSEMSVSLGGSRYFYDADGAVCWIPEKEYVPGRWGYTGGEKGRVKTRRGSQPCSNLDILGTGDDPLYQMQRRGLSSFRADVPDGRYFVYLHFCELSAGKDGAVSLVYNLGNDVIAQDAQKRVFSVSINSVPVLENYDIRLEAGAAWPVVKRFTVDVEGGKGLTIGFTPVEGEPVLNAVRIFRILK